MDEEQEQKDAAEAAAMKIKEEGETGVGMQTSPDQIVNENEEIVHEDHSVQHVIVKRHGSRDRSHQKPKASPANNSQNQVSNSCSSILRF